MAGAALAGSPGIAAGHNGFAAWGVTAGLIDNADLYVEEGLEASSMHKFADSDLQNLYERIQDGHVGQIGFTAVGHRDGEGHG